MERTHTIVVALGEQPDALLLTSAVDMARRYGSKLFLLRIVDPPASLSAPHGLFVAASTVTNGESAALQHLVKVAAGVPADLVVDTLVRSGVAWEVICETARDQHADLIVMAAHGNGGRWRRSTAAQVVDRAVCPVVVVRDQVRAAA